MNIYASENPWLSFEIKDQIDSYLNDCRARRLSPKTLEVYSFYLGWFQNWGETVSLTDIRKADQVILRNFLESIQTTDKGVKRSPHTIHGMYRSLRSFFAYLVKEEVLPASPFAKLTAPRLPKKILLPLTEDEVKTIINHWKKWEAKPASQRTGLDLFQLRNLALFLFMLDSGIRVQECSQINITDVDFKTGRVFVRCGKGEKDRITFISEETLKYLKQYVRLFPSLDKELWMGQYGPVTSQGIRMIFKRLSRELRLQVSPHKIRRTFAIMMLRNGADVYRLKEMMGHADIRTLERYLYICEDDISNCHKSCSPISHQVSTYRRSAEILEC